MIDTMIIPLAALAIPLIIAPVAIVSKAAQRKRELEHAERMRALELGSVLKQDEPWWTPSRIVVLIGGVVPISALGLAGFLAWFGEGRPGLWEACGLVAATGVACGTFLGGRLISVQAQVDRPALKPQYDPDAFDVVGSRG
jgi:hypothetical protein